MLQKWKWQNDQADHISPFCQNVIAETLKSTQYASYGAPTSMKACQMWGHGPKECTGSVLGNVLPDRQGYHWNPGQSEKQNIMSQRCSIGFRSSGNEGQSMVSIPSSSRHCLHTLATWGQASSCTRGGHRSHCITVGSDNKFKDFILIYRGLCVLNDFAGSMTFSTASSDPMKSWSTGRWWRTWHFWWSMANCQIKLYGAWAVSTVSTTLGPQSTPLEGSGSSDRLYWGFKDTTSLSSSPGLSTTSVASSFMRSWNWLTASSVSSLTRLIDT